MAQLRSASSCVLAIVTIIVENRHIALPNCKVRMAMHDNSNSGRMYSCTVSSSHNVTLCRMPSRVTHWCLQTTVHTSKLQLTISRPPQVPKYSAKPGSTSSVGECTQVDDVPAAIKSDPSVPPNHCTHFQTTAGLYVLMCH